MVFVVISFIVIGQKLKSYLQKKVQYRAEMKNISDTECIRSCNGDSTKDCHAPSVC